MRVDPNKIAGITGAQFAIKFNPNVLQVESVTHINTRLELPVTPVIDNSSGTAKFLAFTLTALTGDHPPFDFATVRFKAKAAAPLGPTDITFEWAEGGKKTAVAGPGGNVLANKADFLAARINITEPPDDCPKAIFTRNPAGTGDEGSPIQFDATKSCASTGDLTYDWKFGDGGTGDFVTGDHIYIDGTGDSVYVVTLVVTDGAGTSDSTTGDIPIRNLAPTISLITADDTTVSEGGSTAIRITAVDATGNIPLRYFFDCDGDGSFDIGPQTGGSTGDCTFPDGPSTVTPKVKVEDKDGASITGDGPTITVNNVPPTINSVSASPSQLPLTGDPRTSRITISASDPAGANDPLLYSIDCNGDGDFVDTSTGDTANTGDNFTDCAFPEAQQQTIHTVKATVKDPDGAEDAGSTTVTVKTIEELPKVPVQLRVGPPDINPHETTVGVGVEFDLEIWISPAAKTEQVQAAQVFINFDPSLIQFTKIAPNTKGLPTVLTQAGDNALGHIDYSAVIVSGTPPKGDFLLATVEFKVKSGDQINLPARTETDLKLNFSGARTTAVGRNDAQGQPVAVSGNTREAAIEISTLVLYGKVTAAIAPSLDIGHVFMLTVTLTMPDTADKTGPVIATFKGVISDKKGRLVIDLEKTYVTAGSTYDVRVKDRTTLSNLEEDVQILSSASVLVDFRTLREGDINVKDTKFLKNFDIVNIFDFLSLIAAFGQFGETPKDPLPASAEQK